MVQGVALVSGLISDRARHPNQLSLSVEPRQLFTHRPPRPPLARGLIARRAHGLGIRTAQCNVSFTDPLGFLDSKQN